METEEQKRKRKGNEIARVLALRAASGRLPGPVPLGYHFNDRWEVVPDPETAPLVQQAFELAAEGTLPLRAILAEVTAAGLRSKKGRPLGVSGLWTVLTNPFYAGQVRYKGALLPGAHEPLVGEAVLDGVGRNLRRRQRSQPAHMAIAHCLSFGTMEASCTSTRSRSTTTRATLDQNRSV